MKVDEKTFGDGLDLSAPGAAAVATEAPASAPVDEKTQEIVNSLETIKTETLNTAAKAQATPHPGLEPVPAGLSAEQIDYMNKKSSDAVAAAVQAAMQAVLPLFTKLMEPSPKEKAEQDALDRLLERSRRENAASQKTDKENRRKIALMRARCPHRDKNGKEAINLSHNYYDGRPRGVCVHCNDVIHPCEYRFTPPAYKNTLQDAEWFCGELARQGFPGVKVGPIDDDGLYSKLIWPAHKDYRRVLDLEATQS